MSCSLAVFSPNIGVLAESFICRYMRDLLPGRTAVVAKNERKYPDGAEWHVDGPSLIMSRLSRPGLKRQMIDAIVWQFGIRQEDAAIGAIRRFLKQQGVKIMMSNYLDESLMFFEIAERMGIRFFVHGHGYDVTQMLRNEVMCKAYLAFNRAAGIIVVSEYNRRRLIGIGLNPDLIHVIPGGVDVPDSPVEKPGGDLIRCLALGSMVPKKAPILALDSFRRALAVCPSLRLDYVGEGPLLPAVRHFVQAFKLEPFVTIHGRQPNAVVEPLRRQADIYIQHSTLEAENGDEEGLPVTLLEMMANSVPIVSTRHAGIPEAVVDGVTGYLVEEGDSSAMAECILRLASDVELRRNMGKAGWERARECFTWKKEKRDLLQLMGLEHS